MSTTKTRINVSLSRDITQAIERLAKRDQEPTATKAAALIRLALEIEEDTFLESVARSRDKKRAKFLSHKQVWK